jgi:sialidase-1
LTPLGNKRQNPKKLVSPSKAIETKGFSINPKWANTVGGGTRSGFVNVPLLEGQRPGDSFQFEFNGTAVGLFTAAGPDAGMIEFKIDHGEWTKQDLHTKWSGGLHIPWLFVLASELSPKEKHILHVRIAKDNNSKSKGHACRIVHLAVNGTD